ncbi:lipase family alpha/beta hydrolase [Atopomonas sediminilitoris]|uniref:lipase family alpha/beta hydrolase n=1 Tax=Atopomonas sediminilitoris TaxID=2919919 RepID=UPI001F4E7079|nr:alpha/beta fold hydrolase [Atopomonas sediminilitoris]MCJ8168918.1 alpha/beta fold hydrolase [Atopomonas sediminilitoris]
MRLLTCVTLVLTGLLSLSTAQAGTYTQTKYPIVLVHGIAGFDSIGGLVNYFYTVPWNLERDGARVHVASVASFNNSYQRGAELAKQIAPWAQAGGGKVNIIGHSQGSPTARIAMALRPELVASITSVDGVNHGSKVADVVLGIAPAGSLSQSAMNALVSAVGKIINGLSGADHPQSFTESLRSLSSPESAAINARHPWGVGNYAQCGTGSEVESVLGHSVQFFSWTGRSRFTNPFDPLDYFFATAGSVFGRESSDAMVGTCSTKLGKVIGTDYAMNHGDAINHLLGLRGWTSPVSLYRQHANRLKSRGL